LNTNFYVSTTFAQNGSNINDVLNLCEKHNIHNIELGSNHAFLVDPVSVIRGRNLNFLTHNYFPPGKDSFVLNIASLDPVVKQKSIDFVLNSIRFTSDVGSMLYTIHPGFLVDPTKFTSKQNNYDFNFENKNVDDYNKTFNSLLESLSVIYDFAKNNNVKVALETEGSITKSKYLLMQRPEEFSVLFDKINNHDVLVNLNIGHLLLASNACSFKICDFLDVVKDNVVAMELSHNNGSQDEHKPLVLGEWYWGVINDKRFHNAYKILELRNLDVLHVLENLNLCYENINN